MCACLDACHVRLSATLWTIARQAPLSMEFLRLEYRRGLPRPRPSDLPDPGIEPWSLTYPVLADGFFNTSATWEAISCIRGYNTIRLTDTVDTVVLVLVFVSPRVACMSVVKKCTNIVW